MVERIERKRWTVRSQETAERDPFINGRKNRKKTLDSSKSRNSRKRPLYKCSKESKENAGQFEVKKQQKETPLLMFERIERKRWTVRSQETAERDPFINGRKNRKKTLDSSKSRNSRKRPLNKWSKESKENAGQFEVKKQQKETPL